MRARSWREARWLSSTGRQCGVGSGGGGVGGCRLRGVGCGEWNGTGEGCGFVIGGEGGANPRGGLGAGPARHEVGMRKPLPFG
eukprot:scaffold15196_cov121-Isochrysis_galbana.AAC.5